MRQFSKKTRICPVNFVTLNKILEQTVVRSTSGSESTPNKICFDYVTVPTLDTFSAIFL